MNLINKSVIYTFCSDINYYRKRFKWQWFLPADFFPIFLKIRTTDQSFQQSRKQDSFKNILKRSANMYRSSGSQFFRTTTRIQQLSDT